MARGRPRQEGGLHDISPPATIPAAGDVLALSDERDLWLRRLLAVERDAYDLGYERGVEDGRRAVLAEETAFRRWASGHLRSAGPPYAALELRRWGPGGRDRAGDPRPGDYPGQGGEAA